MFEPSERGATTIRPLNLYYFGRGEFERGGVNWFDRMDPRLLVLLDSFRHQWGKKVVISPHPAAIGRELGPTRLSDHNVDLHGAVLGIDVMPEGMRTQMTVNAAVRIARSVGFTAIGVYPDWQPAAGLHLGTRTGRHPTDPAVWGAVRGDDGQDYVALDVAVNRFRAA